MRIVYILTSLGIGGAERQVISIAERMALRGHSVSLLVLKYTDEEWPVKLPVLRLNLEKKLTSVWRGLRFAQKFLAIVNPDILHSHTFPANLFARTLRILLAFQPNSPILINTIHNTYEGGWHRMLLYRMTDSWVDCVTAVSSAVADRFVQIGSVPKRKMKVLTNGIETGTFIAKTSIRNQTRSRMQTGADFIWIAVGRLSPAKDYPNLLRAFAQVHQVVPGAKLWIAGEGDLADHPEIALDFSRHGEGVQWLGLRNDIPELLNAADAYVLSSAWEGMPLAVGEAMASAKPVVATHVGGVEELLGTTGVIVPPNDSAALAESMKYVMSLSPAERAAMGRSAQQGVQASFTIEAKIGEWEGLYAETLARGRG